MAQGILNGKATKCLLKWIKKMSEQVETTGNMHQTRTKPHSNTAESDFSGSFLSQIKINVDNIYLFKNFVYLCIYIWLRNEPEKIIYKNIYIFTSL